MGEKELGKLHKVIISCEKCPLHKTRTNTVHGEGPADAKIMFVGESPGFWEDKIGKPFIGPAGKFLDKLFDLIELKRNKFYITNVLKCRPKIDNRDRPPEKEEITACKPCLLKQIDIIKPKLIVLLGNVAIKALLDEKLRVSDIHGKVTEKEGIKYFPTFHPSAAMRFTKMRRNMEKDFKEFKELIELP